MNELRSIIRDILEEAGPKPASKAKISASSEYMKKEAVKQQLQDLITAKIAAGEIQTQMQLEEWFSSASMALMTLKMIPIEAYSLLSKKRK